MDLCGGVPGLGLPVFWCPVVVQAPRAAENFRALCTGEKGRAKIEGVGEGPRLHYKGAEFYRVIDRFICQTGIETPSIYGGEFDDDPGALELKHDKVLGLSHSTRGLSHGSLGLSHSTLGVSHSVLGLSHSTRGLSHATHGAAWSRAGVGSAFTLGQGKDSQGQDTPCESVRLSEPSPLTVVASIRCLLLCK